MMGLEGALTILGMLGAGLSVIVLLDWWGRRKDRRSATNAK